MSRAGHATGHIAVTGQNVFYINPVSGNDTWSGRYPHHRADLITGDDIIAGGEGPFSTIQAACRFAITGNGGNPFHSAVAIVMSDGGSTGSGAEAFATTVTGDWWHEISDCSVKTVTLPSTSGSHLLIVGGNTGGNIDGTIASVMSVTGFCGFGDNNHKWMFKVQTKGISFMNLDFIGNNNPKIGAVEITNSSLSDSNHTFFSNCNFIRCGQGIGATTGSHVEMNSCAFMSCGHTSPTGAPPISATNLILFGCELNSPKTSIGIVITGGSHSTFKSYSSDYINYNVAVYTGLASTTLIGNNFISGNFIDVMDSTNGTSRHNKISIDNLHWDAATGYDFGNDSTAAYLVANMFGNDTAFNQMGNSLTTGNYPTGDIYAVTGTVHNMLQRGRAGYVSNASSKNTAGENGFYTSMVNTSTSKLLPENGFRGTLGEGGRLSININHNMIKESFTAHPAWAGGVDLYATHDNSSAWRNEMIGGFRTVPARQDDGGIGNTRCTQETCVSLYNCADMQCCCQQIGDNNPVDECGWSGNGIIYDHKKAPLRGDPGQHATGYGSGGERFDGWCQSLTIEEGGGTTGDNCCGGTGAPGGCYGGQISVY